MNLSYYWQKVKYGSNWSKPYYMAKLVSNVAKRRFFGKYPLRGVDFSVTYACNMKCRHCFNHSLLKGHRKMEMEDYVRVIDEAKKLGALNFAFQGGEFFLLDNFAAFLKLVDSRKYSLSITTNGLLLNNGLIDKLKKMGVNTLTISLDSGLPEEHDAFRGMAGSFDNAVKGIDIAMAKGIKVVVNSTVSHDSLKTTGFRRLLHLAQKKGFLLNTIFAAPSGKWFNNTDIILNEEDKQYYYELVKNNPLVIRDIDSGYVQKGCQGGTESLYLTPYGDVLPCPYIHIRAGSIFEESLESIRDRAMKYFHYQDNCLIAENKMFIQQYTRLTKDLSLPLRENYLERIDAWDS